MGIADSSSEPPAAPPIGFELMAGPFPASPRPFPKSPSLKKQKSELVDLPSFITKPLHRTGVTARAALEFGAMMALLEERNADAENVILFSSSS